VYTKKGIGAGSSVLDKTFAKTKLSGYSIAREFFSPNYDLSPEARSLPDKRVTLYWNPHVKFDVTGKTTIRFFNNDVAKKIRIIIQGLDSQGRMIYKEEIYQ
jgi:hypothetical protein